MAMNLHDSITSKQTYVAKSLKQINDGSKKLIELILRFISMQKTIIFSLATENQ